MSRNNLIRKKDSNNIKLGSIYALNDPNELFPMMPNSRSSNLSNIRYSNSNNFIPDCPQISRKIDSQRLDDTIDYSYRFSPTKNLDSLENIKIKDNQYNIANSGSSLTFLEKKKNLTKAIRSGEIESLNHDIVRGVHDQNTEIGLHNLNSRFSSNFSSSSTIKPHHKKYENSVDFKKIDYNLSNSQIKTTVSEANMNQRGDTRRNHKLLNGLHQAKTNNPGRYSKEGVSKIDLKNIISHPPKKLDIGLFESSPSFSKNGFVKAPSAHKIEENQENFSDSVNNEVDLSLVISYEPSDVVDDEISSEPRLNPRSYPTHIISNSTLAIEENSTVSPYQENAGIHTKNLYYNPVINLEDGPITESQIQRSISGNDPASIGVSSTQENHLRRKSNNCNLAIDMDSCNTNHSENGSQSAPINNRNYKDSNSNRYLDKIPKTKSAKSYRMNRIRIQRDYLLGDICRFQEYIPLELQSKISSKDYSDFICKVNSLLQKAEGDRLINFMEGFFTCITLYMYLLVSKSHHQKTILELAQYIRDSNEIIFNPAGYSVVDPRQTAFMFVSIIGIISVKLF
ncbi:Golgin subfamily A member 7B [Smittium mucronatum]|uniref:Ras modification protein ERF4 n=1 Tax=Smittium mucronatum TaxID=133383 RepID=A0A1R0GUH3_9FUNG|nr:Golgin subfamily A member 7B [Smittium mucronatum]